MSYGGYGSLEVARQNVIQRAKLAARDPCKSRQSNPESRARPDLRQIWDRNYLRECSRLAYEEGLTS